MNSTELYHQHPIKILSYTTKFFWLLLIPLVRGLITIKWDFSTWVRGAWIDISVITLIFIFAYTRWYNVKFSFNRSSVTITNGIYLKNTYSIPYCNISAYTVEKNYFLNLINANKLKIDTNTGSKKKSDISLTVNKNYADQFLKTVKEFNISHDLKSTYCPKKSYLYVFSLLFSNTLSGAILIATLIYQSGQYIGRELESRVMFTVSEITRKLSIDLPPAAIYLSLFIICGWVLSFTLNMLRYWRFSASRKGSILTIVNGFIIKRIHNLSTPKINYVDFRQSILTMLFRVSSVHVHCTGYGKTKRELAVLIPITTKSQVLNSLKMLLPEFKPSNPSVMPGPHQMQRFILFPILFILTEPLTALILMKIFPSWIEMIIFIAIVFEIPCVWILIVKIVANYTTGIGKKDNFVIIKYNKLYSFHQLIVPQNKISCVKITQTPFQKTSNDCTVIFYTHAEHTKKHKVYNLPLRCVRDFLKELSYDV